MKLNNRIALSIALSAALFSLSAVAEDTAAAPAAPAAAMATPDAAPAKAGKKMHHHMAGAKKTAGHGYDDCMKQKLAVAEYFCSIHTDACKAEKDGAAKQCRSEARGERQKG